MSATTCDVILYVEHGCAVSFAGVIITKTVGLMDYSTAMRVPGCGQWVRSCGVKYYASKWVRGCGQ